MIKYTIHTDEPWTALCAPNHIGQVVELIESHTTLTPYHPVDVWTAHKTLRYVACSDTDGNLYWERVPLPHNRRRTIKEP